MRKFDVNAPVDIKPRGGIEYVYWQNGGRVDADDMTEHLRKRPETRHDAETARTLSTVAKVAGIAGGALVGWPIGEALGGNPDPLWILAGVGAGVIVLAFPLEIAASNSMHNAVATHNGLVRSARAKRTPKRDRTPRKAAAPTPRTGDGGARGNTERTEPRPEPQPPETPW